MQTNQVNNGHKLRKLLLLFVIFFLCCFATFCLIIYLPSDLRATSAKAKGRATRTATTYNQGWQYGTVRSEFAYYVPRTLNRTVPAYRISVQFWKRTVPTYRTRTITKNAYRTSVPYFLAKIESYRTVPTYHTAILAFSYSHL